MAALAAPAVSVIVPNYNHAAYLRHRLDSILGQTFTDFELIILDDASTDNSRGVITEYLSKSRVRFVGNDRNSGSPFVQWNRGVALARGEFVWLAESDDFAEPRFLDRLLPLLQSHPHVGLAYCQSWRVDANGNKHGTLAEEVGDLDSSRWESEFVSRGSDECRRFLLWKNTIPNASAVVFRRDIYLRAGGAPETMRLAGDWLTWVRMLAISDVAFAPERLNYFRRHEATARAAASWRTFFDERWVVQRFIVEAGLTSADDRRKLAALVTHEYLTRVRSAPPGHRRAEVTEGWRRFGLLLLRTPRTAARVLLLRAWARNRRAKAPST